MSGAQFTPGPWVADAIAENGDIRINAVSSPVVIASAHNGVSFSDLILDRHPKEQWANARLIAAAPDMLMALRTILGALDDPTGGQHVADMRAASEVARVAIAKATGQGGAS